MASERIEGWAICTKCKIKKPLSAFYKRKGVPSGRHLQCKQCKKEQISKNYQANIKEKKKYAQEYQQLNQEKIKKYRKQYAIDNKKEVAAKRKKYYLINKNNILERNRRWRIKNSEKIRAYKIKTRDRERKRLNKSRQERSELRLNHTISTAIYRSLKGIKKGRKWQSLVGYTARELKRHLENLFIPGMTWKNYGKWHLDHIIPVSVFNFTNAGHRDFKRCWALKNLQPMWATENMVKGSKLDKHFQPSLLI